ncbi:MAG: HAMP domain-containing histidine kinase [Cyanobacteria bacterium SZAS LIN-3]|nr:HAMP domain-containing histidine kinase [Cyanobacteria bacterium SZAS LIN-3]MBS2005721.1 HAMP domain-containing histidine kinase [Cyanobacteria bacterium SZAS TMP-1]
MDNRQLQVELALLKHALADCTCAHNRVHLSLVEMDGLPTVSPRPLSGVARAMAHALRSCEINRSELARRVRELEADNLAMKALLQQRENFVASLTHDLKNPLIGATRALDAMASGKLQQEQQTAIVKQLIITNKAMLRMIWNLLDTYKHDSGKMLPLNSVVSVPELLEQCLSEFAYNLNMKQIEAVLSIADGLPEVNTDEILLRRVLINLIDNAVKFMPEGGTLCLQASMVCEQLRISVKDTGPGLSPEHVERTFERFFQTEHHREKGFGTGLGLFLSRQIMETLGGKIECSSVENQGTEFILYLDRERRAS